MPFKKNALSLAVLSLAATLSLPVWADEDDALNLQAEPAKPAAASAPSQTMRLALELAAITAQRQPDGGSVSGHRASIDLRLSAPLGQGWRWALSDRLDDIQPVQAGQRGTRNQLREAYLNWQQPDGNTGLELGRLNLRHGPAYGYNPTDYFRAGATRLIVTADPVALRENRLGTFMLRANRSWDGGGASLVLAPKLTSSGPSDQALSLDLGATNTQDRLLAVISAKASARWSGEALALYERGTGTKLGANLTGLLTDALVLQGEWSTSRSDSLLNQALAQAAAPQRVHQAALGLTWSAPFGWVITGEAEYNGAGLNQAGWRNLLAQAPNTVGRFFASTQADQELASRRAWLLYATQKGVAGIRQLDVTGFVRQNADDHSHLAWAELRYHWPRVDAALQWQRSSRGALTEYGSLPYRQVLQLLGSVYF